MRRWSRKSRKNERNEGKRSYACVEEVWYAKRDYMYINIETKKKKKKKETQKRKDEEIARTNIRESVFCNSSLEKKCVVSF